MFKQHLHLRKRKKRRRRSTRRRREAKKEQGRGRERTKINQMITRVERREKFKLEADVHELSQCLTKQ